MGSVAAGAIAACIGGVIVVGWLTGAVLPWDAAGAIKAKTNTGVGLLLSGGALMLLAGGRRSAAALLVGRTAACAVILLGALTLSEHLLSLDLGIDELVAREPAGVAGIATHNRMGPLGAASLVLLGVAFLTIQGRPRRLAPAIGLLVCVVNLVPAAGYLVGATNLYNVPQIAWTTVIGLMALSVGVVLAVPEAAPVSILRRDDAGGRLLRVLLPLAIVLPPGMSFLRTLGERLELYDAPTGRGLFIVLMALALAVVSWRSAAWLSRSDRARQRVMADLSRSESRSRRLLEQLPAAVYECDAEGRITLFNEAAVELWGREPRLGEEFWNGAWRMRTPGGAVIPIDQGPMAITLRDRREVRGMEMIVVRPDGEHRHVLPFPTPIFDDKGQLVGAVNMLMDITELKQAEQDLAGTRDDLSRQVAGLTRLHELTMFISAAPSLATALEATLEAAIAVHGSQRGVLSLLDPASGSLEVVASRGLPDEALELLSGITPGDDRGEAGGSHQLRERVIVGDTEIDPSFEPYREVARLAGFRSVHSTPITTRTGEPLGVLAIFSSSPHVPSDLEMQLSDMCVQNAAISIEAARAQSAVEESQSRFRIMADSAPNLIWMSGVDKLRIWFNRPWLEFTGRTMEQEIGDGWAAGVHPDDLARCLAVYSEGFDARRDFRMEYRMRRDDGEYRWLLDHGVPLVDADGVFSGYIGSCTDVTDQVLARKSMEEQRAALEAAVKQRTAQLDETNQRLRLTERMASLGTLSAGLGHDMGNLLLPIRIRLDSLARSGASREGLEDIEAIRSSVQYLQRLSSGMRMLAMDPSRSQPGELTSLPAWWADAAPVMRNVLPQAMRLEEAVPKEEVWVAMPRAALTQVIFNLVQNAGDVMRQRGAGTVRVWAERSGDVVTIGVSDNGPGMSEEVKRRCLEPFFTTKSRSLSTGLGLALVYGLVHDAGGKVNVESSHGVGTTFRLVLPCVDRAATEVEKRPSRRAFVGVADARLSAFVRAELGLLSFEVIQGAAPRDDVELIVLDSLNGTVAAPQARVVVLSGTGHELDSVIALTGEDSRKPSAIRAALRRAAGGSGTPGASNASNPSA